MNWFSAMLPSFIVAALLCAGELLVRPEKSDWWRNLQAWALQAGAAFTLLPLFQFANLPSLFDGDTWPAWAGVIFYLVLRDALEYFYHRAQHAIPLLWSVHAMHHSDPNMSALTTNRHFWGDQLIKAVTIWPLAALVIAPTPIMIGMFTLASFWHFVVHARLRISFGPLSWLLNSPAYHRRHHSSLPEHYNSNYSALFPIFDVLCGSYNRPDGWPPTGLDREPETLLDLLAWPVRSEGEPAKATQ
jgi:sterol desaturase/sphingolipid hydroxylase (fatty acid hydroxylase superfamily)